MKGWCCTSAAQVAHWTGFVTENDFVAPFKISMLSSHCDPRYHMPCENVPSLELLLPRKTLGA